jgi:beta-lactam-binding protein with PASTA domain
MPDMAYRSSEEIQLQLESLGFQVRVRNHGTVIRGLSSDTIIRHIPSPGFPISAGEPITLYRNQ